MFDSGTCSDDEILETIGKVWHENGYLLDPHSAVGWKVASSIQGDAPVICLATAHPAKFPAAVVDATGEDLAHHPLIDALSGAETRCYSVPSSAQAIKEFLAGACIQ